MIQVTLDSDFGHRQKIALKPKHSNVHKIKSLHIHLLFFLLDSSEIFLCLNIKAGGVVKAEGAKRGNHEKRETLITLPFFLEI